MRYRRGKIGDTKPNSPKAAVPIVDTADFVAHSQVIPVDTRVPMHDTGNLSVHTRNAVVDTEIAGVHNEGRAARAGRQNGGKR